MIDIVCEFFGCTPKEALEQDEDLTWRVINARTARRAVWAFDAEGVTTSPSQNATYTLMLDALDARARRLGIPEEI